MRSKCWQNVIFLTFHTLCLDLFVWWKAHSVPVRCACDGSCLLDGGLSHRLPVSRIVSLTMRDALSLIYIFEFFSILPFTAIISSATVATAPPASQMKNILMNILHLRIRVIALWNEVWCVNVNVFERIMCVHALCCDRKKNREQGTRRRTNVWASFSPLCMLVVQSLDIFLFLQKKRETNTFICCRIQV